MSELKMYGTDKVPKYCGLCGTALIRKEYFEQYDAATGQPLYGTKLYCPTFMRFITCHTNLEFNSDGYEIIYRYS